MKTFEVELRRESFIVVTVEALNAAHAEEMAWKEIEGSPDSDDASWVVESIEEVGGTK